MKTTTTTAATAADDDTTKTKKKSKTTSSSSLFRSIQRKIEYSIGKQMLSYVNDISLKQCQLQYKTIYLPKSKLTMHYYEREFLDYDMNAVAAGNNNNNKKKKNKTKTTTITTTTTTSPPAPTTTDATSTGTTLVFLHGLADEGKNFGPFISSLLKKSNNKHNNNVRIIVPDLIGHGNDLKRYKQRHDKNDNKNDKKNAQEEEGEGEDILQLPTPNIILQVTIEFLELVLSSSSTTTSTTTTTTATRHRCHGFGYSIGGALLYYIKYKRPDLFDRTCLIAPSLQYVINDDFVNDFVTNRKNHFCFECRHDAKILFRDLSIPDDDDDDDDNDDSTGPSRHHDRSSRRRSTTTRRRRGRRKKNNPIPKFFLQSIYKLQVQSTPPNHFRNILLLLLESRKRGKFDNHHKIPNLDDDDVQRSGKDDNDSGSNSGNNNNSGNGNGNYDDEDDDKLFHNTHDIDPTSHRLVIWPEYDYICNHDKGKQFFLGDGSSSTTPRGDGNDAMTCCTSEDRKVSVMESTVTNNTCNATPVVGVDPTAPKTSETVSADGIKSNFNVAKVRNTEFITVRDAGHMFHSDGTFILDLDYIHSRIRSFLLD